MKNIKHKIAYSFFIGTVALLACNVDSHKTGESPDSTIEKKESEHAHKDTSEVVVEELVITSKQFKAAGIEFNSSPAHIKELMDFLNQQIAELE